MLTERSLSSIRWYCQPSPTKTRKPLCVHKVSVQTCRRANFLTSSALHLHKTHRVSVLVPALRILLPSHFVVFPLGVVAARTCRCYFSSAQTVASPEALGSVLKPTRKVKIFIWLKYSRRAGSHSCRSSSAPLKATLWWIFIDVRNKSANTGE